MLCILTPTDIRNFVYLFIKVLSLDYSSSLENVHNELPPSDDTDHDSSPHFCSLFRNLRIIIFNQQKLRIIKYIKCIIHKVFEHYLTKNTIVFLFSVSKIQRYMYFKCKEEISLCAKVREDSFQFILNNASQSQNKNTCNFNAYTNKTF